MDEPTMRRRVAEARVGRLATVTPDGHPHVVPCCFAVEADVVYSVVDAKPKTTLALQRLTNLRSNPSVALLVDFYGEDWSALWWVRVDGRGRIVASGPERDRAVALLAAKYHQYGRHPPPGPAIAIETTAWRGWP